MLPVMRLCARPLKPRVSLQPRSSPPFPTLSLTFSQLPFSSSSSPTTTTTTTTTATTTFSRRPHPLLTPPPSTFTSTTQPLTLTYFPPPPSAAKRMFRREKAPTDPNEVLKARGRPSGDYLGPGPWIGLLLAIAVLIGFISYFTRQRNARRDKLRVLSVGNAHIGGDFTMADHHGNVVTNSTYAGKYRLVYFGFTFCPDVCPLELKMMAKIIDQMDEWLGEDMVQPLFVSLDPWRDSLEQIQVYTQHFSPRITGLVGTPEQCTDIAKLHRVYTDSHRTIESVESIGDDDYQVDHSIFIYFMGPDGKFISLYGVEKDTDEILREMEDLLIARNSLAEGWGHYFRSFIGRN